ncbi:MAG: TolC family protein, partial [Myxococcota bacterium]
AQTSETRVSLLDAKNTVATSRSALTLLTGVDLSATALSDAFEPPAPPPTFDDLSTIATGTRQDLSAAVAAAIAARSRVDAEIGRYYPTISVNLDYFLTRETAPTDRDFNGLLSLHLPIFSAGRIDADVRTAWSIFRQSLLRHSLTTREIRRDVEIAHSDLLATHARIAEIGNQLRAAKEALRQAEASYGAGLGTNLERITAQDQLLAAQVRLAREEFNGKIAYLVAMRAAGVLTQVATGTPLDPASLPPRRTPPDSPFIVRPGAAASPSASNASAPSPR